MINGKRVAVVMPAYNAELTLEATVREIPDLVDIRILVDDYSKDKTVEVAKKLGLLGLRSRPAITATAATSRPAIARRWRQAPMSSSWSTPITSTRRC